MTAAYLKYTKFFPAPVILVFQVNGELSVQISDVNDCVSSYELVPDSHRNRLIIFDRPDITTAVGNKAIRAFEVTPGNLLLGTTEELAVQFEKFVARIDIEAFPFTTFELAQLINDSELEKQAAIYCTRTMFDLSHAIANNWLKTTPMSAVANQAATESLERVNKEAIGKTDDERTPILLAIFQRVVKAYQSNTDDKVLFDIEKAIAPIVESAEVIADANSDITYEYDGGYATFGGIQLPEFEADSPDVSIIESNENSVVIELGLYILCDVVGNFSFSVRDSVDRDYMDLGSAEYHRMHEFEASALVKLSGDFDSGLDGVFVEHVEFTYPKMWVDFDYISFQRDHEM